MKLLLLSFCLVVAGLFAACSESLCNQRKDEYTTLEGKMTACPATLQALKSAETSDAACAAAFNDCNSADQTTIENEITCVNALPTCMSDSDPAFASEAAICYDEDSTVTRSCAAGFLAFPAVTGATG